MQILSVDEMGEGIKPIRPQSLVDMMKVRFFHCLGQAAKSPRVYLCAAVKLSASEALVLQHNHRHATSHQADMLQSASGTQARGKCTGYVSFIS